MNIIFLSIVLIAFVVAGFREVTWISPGGAAKSPMQAMADAMIASADTSGAGC